jgi:hypothetical protein
MKLRMIEKLELFHVQDSPELRLTPENFEKHSSPYRKSKRGPKAKSSGI